MTHIELGAIFMYNEKNQKKREKEEGKTSFTLTWSIFTSYFVVKMKARPASHVVWVEFWSCYIGNANKSIIGLHNSHLMFRDALVRV